MHVNPFAPLIGGLKGNLSFPLVVPEESGLEIGAKVFAPRWGSPFGLAPWWTPPTSPPDTRNNFTCNNQGASFWHPIGAGNTRNNNQATFANVQTNISNCSFLTAVGESWAFQFVVMLQATAGVTGCGFNLTVPASTTGAFTVFGCTGAVNTFTSVYTTAITTNTAKSWCTINAVNLFVFINGIVTGSSAAGTVQLQGQSGAAGTTIQINTGTNTISLASF